MLFEICIGPEKDVIFLKQKDCTFPTFPAETEVKTDFLPPSALQWVVSAMICSPAFFGMGFSAVPAMSSKFCSQWPGELSLGQVTWGCSLFWNLLQLHPSFLASDTRLSGVFKKQQNPHPNATINLRWPIVTNKVCCFEQPWKFFNGIAEMNCTANFVTLCPDDLQDKERYVMHCSNTAKATALREEGEGKYLRDI